MSQQWFLKISDEVHGPVSSAELQRLAETGAVSAETPVSLDGQRWRQAAAVKGLVLRTFASAAQSRPAPPPPPVAPAAAPALQHAPRDESARPHLPFPAKASAWYGIVGIPSVWLVNTFHTAVQWGRHDLTTGNASGRVLVDILTFTADTALVVLMIIGGLALLGRRRSGCVMLTSGLGAWATLHFLHVFAVTSIVPVPTKANLPVNPVAEGLFAVTDLTQFVMLIIVLVWLPRNARRLPLI